MTAKRWQTMLVPMTIGIRHSRVAAGYVISLGQSHASVGYTTKANWINKGVSR